ncbi:MAG: helix-hairpin-helix domain-containing protein [Flavobacteriia bacterium]|nr:helix-hairpin-helix domain-containing protein [Flavobacteriia bacterium]
MKFRNALKISKKNRVGVILLAILTFCIIFFPRILIYFSDSDSKFSAIASKSKIWEFKEKTFQKHVYYKPSYSKKSKYKIPPKHFDPNTYSESDWLNLGLSEKQVAVVLKFTKRGIRSNEDLKRIFVIPAQLYELIKDSTTYPTISNEAYKKEIILEKVVLQKIEINAATEEQLMEIKGIGSFFAKQIIRKRLELGGFVSKEQLLEVWKMDQEKYDLIKDLIVVDSKKINKIAINSATIEELKAHPYIRWNIANSIIKMREQKNGFQSIDELKESKLIDEEKFQKIKMYLTL